MTMKLPENETLATLKARRSCRAYKPQPVTEEELAAVLEAGVYAPTGMGAQSPVIVAVQDTATRDELSRLNAAVMGTANDPFYGAPTVLVVLADAARSTHVEDGSLVIGNLLNAAASLGLGSCWIHRAREVFAAPEGKALLKKWGVPNADRLVGVGHCVLGYPAEGGIKEAAPRKENYVTYVK